MKRSIKALSAAAFLAVFAATASADPIRITTLDITAFPDYGDGTVYAEIVDAVNDWNALYDPDLPTDPDILKVNPSEKVEIGEENVYSIEVTVSDPNAYVFLHWGGPNDDPNYDNPQLFFMNDVTTWTFEAPIHYSDKGEKIYGLSFYSVYVPDGGTTVAMLGATVLVILGVSRQMNRRKLRYARRD